MPVPKFRLKFSRGVSFPGKTIRISGFAQQVNLSSRENDDEIRSRYVRDCASASAQLAINI